MKIKLWDNEGYNYPLIIIKDEGLKDFKKTLKNYQKNDGYNIDDFIWLIENKDYYIDHISYEGDVELFF